MAIRNKKWAFTGCSKKLKVVSNIFCDCVKEHKTLVPIRYGFTTKTPRNKLFESIRYATQENAGKCFLNFLEHAIKSFKNYLKTFKNCTFMEINTQLN